MADEAPAKRDDIKQVEVVLVKRIAHKITAFKEFKYSKEITK